MYSDLIKKEFGSLEDIEIVVGIPTKNEGDNISFVARQVDRGLSETFPGKRALLIDCDSVSEDDTKKKFLETETFASKKYITTPPGVLGKGNAFRMFFEIVRHLKPKAVMVVDADLTSISPQWVRMMLMPIFNGYDYVAPYYTRNRFDGSITNHICFPVLYGLLGYNVRQPIAGDFAFSPKLNDYWLRQEWTETTGFYGIDIFMTTHALFGNFSICQVSLGEKSHKPSAPKLDRMFSEVVGTLFDNITSNKGKWLRKNFVTDVKIMGAKTLEEPKLGIDKEKILSTAFLNYKKDLAKKYLEKETFEKINDMFYRKEIRISGDLWAKAVYDSLFSYYSYRRRKIRKEIVESLKALYFGRMYSFINDFERSPVEAVDEAFREQAEDFRKMRPYFIEKITKIGRGR